MTTGPDISSQLCEHMHKSTMPLNKCNSTRKNIQLSPLVIVWAIKQYLSFSSFQNFNVTKKKKKKKKIKMGYLRKWQLLISLKGVLV